MFEVLKIESPRKLPASVIVSDLRDFADAVDVCMGIDAANWIYAYVARLNAKHNEELEDLKDKCEAAIDAVRKDRDERIAEMEEKLCT